MNNLKLYLFIAILLVFTIIAITSSPLSLTSFLLAASDNRNGEGNNNGNNGNGNDNDDSGSDDDNDDGGSDDDNDDGGSDDDNDDGGSDDDNDDGGSDDDNDDGGSDDDNDNISDNANNPKPEEGEIVDDESTIRINTSANSGISEINNQLNFVSLSSNFTNSNNLTN